MALKIFISNTIRSRQIPFVKQIKDGGRSLGKEENDKKCHKTF